MKYEKITAQSRKKILLELQSEDPERISVALVQAALHDMDRKWVEELIVQHLESEHIWVRIAAAKCAGHVARIHGELSSKYLKQRLPMKCSRSVWLSRVVVVHSLVP